MSGIPSITYISADGDGWGPLQGFLLEALITAGVNATVGACLPNQPHLDELGVRALPAVIISGEVVLQGRFPTIDDCHEWLSGLIPDYDPEDPLSPHDDFPMPDTLDEAVAILLKGMSPDDLASLAAIAEEDLIMYHHGWGTGIRNAFGLWHNRALVESCGCEDPDDASMVIIRGAWKEAKKASPRA